MAHCWKTIETKARATASLDENKRLAHMFGCPNQHVVSFQVTALGLMIGLLAGCGGGNTTTAPQPSPPSPSPSVEALYVAEATGNNSGTLQAFTVDGSGGLTSVGNAITIAGLSLGTTSLAAAPNGTFLYAGVGQGVRMFSITPSNGALTEISGGPQLPDGNIVFRLVMHPSGHFLYVSNSNAASETDNLSIFQVNSSTGALVQSLFVPDVDISAIDPQGKFAYSSGATQTGNFLRSFAVDPNSGAPTAVGDVEETAFLESILPHTSGSFVYGIFIGAPGVEGFSVSSTGQMASLGIVESTCSGADFGGPGLMHPSGKFLYHFTSQPGVIVRYAVNGTTGALSDESCFSIPPGTFNPVDNVVTGVLDPAGQFLFAASFDFQTNASTLHTFQVDAGSGALTLLSNTVPLGSGIFSGSMLAVRTGQP